ncbi:hypothetical protein AAVH_26488 [Aphelenchoides avenae]|nr:hypothetical protein AAVH_26488 [Aphelenchus avenae]
MGQTSDVVPIVFDKSIKVDANKQYTASVTGTGPNVYYGRHGTVSKTVSTKKGQVVFNFVQAATSVHTTVAQGMIPEIHFRL